MDNKCCLVRHVGSIGEHWILQNARSLTRTLVDRTVGEGIMSCNVASLCEIDFLYAL